MEKRETSWLSFLTSSAGITFLFLAVGYVVESSHKRLLGVAVAHGDPTGYIEAAAGFLLDTLEMYAKAVADPVPVLVLTGGLLAIILLVGRSSRASKAWVYLRDVFARIVHSVPVLPEAAVAVLLLLKILYFDIPVYSLPPILLQGGLLPEYAGGCCLPKWEYRVRKNLWGLHYPEVTGTGKAAKVSAIIGPTDYSQQIDQELLMNITLTAFLGLTGYLLMRRHWQDGELIFLPRRMVPRWQRTAEISFYLLMIVGIFFLPYDYGKLRRSTDYDRAWVYYESLAGADLPGQGTVNEKEACANCPISGERKVVRKLHGFVLADNLDGLYLYNIENGEVLGLPKHKVVVVEYEKVLSNKCDRDIVCSHLKLLLSS